MAQETRTIPKWYDALEECESSPCAVYERVVCENESEVKSTSDDLDSESGGISMDLVALSATVVTQGDGL